MSRITNILTKVNTIIANKGRWEESNLLDLLDSAQNLIARRTEVLKKTTVVPLVEGQADYKLDEATYKIYRVLYQGKALPIRTREFLDHTVSLDWETHKGKLVELVLVNLLEIPVLRVYPIPEGGDDEISTPPYGVITDITEAEFNSVYGVVTDITLSGLSTGTALLVYHSYTPPTLVDTNSELLLSHRYDTAMVHYVAAMALRQNEDTQSRGMAGEELQLFQAELQQAYTDASKEGTGDASTFAVNYRGAFNS